MMAAPDPKRAKINDSDCTVEPSYSEQIKGEPSDSEQIKVEPSDSDQIKGEPSDSPANGDSESDDEDKANWPLYQRPSMTDEEYMQYLKAAIKSKGFDVPRFEGSCPGGIVPMGVEGNYELLSSLSKQALDEYNTKKNAAFRFVELVRANHQAVAGKMYYITFKAKDGDDDNRQTFKTKVWKKVANKGIEVMSCEKE